MLSRLWKPPLLSIAEPCDSWGLGGLCWPCTPGSSSSGTTTTTSSSTPTLVDSCLDGICEGSEIYEFISVQMENVTNSQDPTTELDCDECEILNATTVLDWNALLCLHSWTRPVPWENFCDPGFPSNTWHLDSIVLRVKAGKFQVDFNMRTLFGPAEFFVVYAKSHGGTPVNCIEEIPGAYSFDAAESTVAQDDFCNWPGTVQVKGASA